MNSMSVPYASRYPLLEKVAQGQPVLLVNQELRPFHKTTYNQPLNFGDVQEAANRLQRFAPVLAELFPQLRPVRGCIESELIPFDLLESKVEKGRSFGILHKLLKTGGVSADALPQGKFFFKADHQLPVAGSVKARGGIYEVLCFAEELALQNGLLALQDNYLKLLAPKVKAFFAKYTIAVGSTGNLGISIGLVAKALGFQAVVHMSREAKGWKKRLLRQHGVLVIEHESDYSAAVCQGRMQAAKDPLVYFVDDESSVRLFLGYSVAGLRLKAQLETQGIVVDDCHPLFVYLPCGVGGAPGGITFGLKQLYGDAVHCFFAEPTQAPCLTIALFSGLGNKLSIYDLGLTLQTCADGLAVGRASSLVLDLVTHLVAGCFTVTDHQLYSFLAVLADHGLKVEPSGLAGCAGPGWLLCDAGQEYLISQGIKDCMDQATHILWLTGGSLVPEHEFVSFVERAKRP